MMSAVDTICSCRAWTHLDTIRALYRDEYTVKRRPDSITEMFAMQHIVAVVEVIAPFDSLE